MSKSTYLSASQAAQRLGVHVRTVRRLIDAGTLHPAGKMDGRTGAYLLSVDEVDALRRERDARGRERSA